MSRLTCPLHSSPEFGRHTALTRALGPIRVDRRSRIPAYIDSPHFSLTRIGPLAVQSSGARMHSREVHSTDSLWVVQPFNPPALVCPRPCIFVRVIVPISADSCRACLVRRAHSSRTVRMVIPRRAKGFQKKARLRRVEKKKMGSRCTTTRAEQMPHSLNGTIHGKELFAELDH